MIYVSFTSASICFTVFQSIFSQNSAFAYIWLFNTFRKNFFILPNYPIAKSNSIHLKYYLTANNIAARAMAFFLQKLSDDCLITSLLVGTWSHIHSKEQSVRISSYFSIKWLHHRKLQSAMMRAFACPKWESPTNQGFFACSVLANHLLMNL